MAVLTAVLLIVCMLLTGCALIESSGQRALITNSTGEIQAVATRADRRITFVDRNWMWGEDRERENVAYRMTMASTLSPTDQLLFDGYQAHHYCAEPSPDVSEELLTQLAASVGTQSHNLGAERLSESGFASLFARSQGVQLFRDGLFALCQAHHNGAVGSEDYTQVIDSLIEKASYLIALELALAPAARGQDQTALAEVIDSALARLQPLRSQGKAAGNSPGFMAITD